MLAMTLIAMGLTHPEGHDFLGKSEQALMMMVSVFLKPALIVLSFITSIILTYIGMEIIVTAFTTFMSDLWLAPTMETGKIGSSTSPLSALGNYMGNLNATHTALGLFENASSSLVALPICLLAFTYAVYETTTQIFQLINTLPDQIFAWIGVQSRQSYFNASQGNDKIKGGIDSAALRGSKQMSNAMGTKSDNDKGNAASMKKSQSQAAAVAMED